MAYRSYRGSGRRKRNAGKIAGMIVAVFLVVVILVGVFVLQDALVFTSDGVQLDASALFGTTTAKSAATLPPVTLPPATTGAAEKAELVTFKPTVQPSVDVEDAVLPSGERLVGQIGRLLSRANLRAADFASTARLLKASKETVAVLEVKTPDGRLSFLSSTSIASRAGANASATEDFYLRDAILLLKENGITVVGRLSCLSDDLMAEVDENWVLYGSDGSAVKNAAGHTILNPASGEVRGYLTAIATEAAVLGFDVLLLSDLGIPAGVEMNEELEDALVSLMKDIDNVLGTRGLALTLYFERDYAQPGGLREPADEFWASQKGLGARYLLDASGVVSDTRK